MSTLAETVRDQTELAGWIKNFWTNTAKKGEANLTAGYLSGRKSILDEYWKSFISRHRMIMNDPNGPKSIYATADVFVDTEEAFFENLGRIQDRINALESPSTSKVTLTDPAGSAVVPCTGHSNPNAQLANLERLKLPTFDGDWLN